jgi:hypothetical protein
VGGAHSYMQQNNEMIFVFFLEVISRGVRITPPNETGKTPGKTTEEETRNVRHLQSLNRRCQLSRFSKPPLVPSSPCNNPNTSRFHTIIRRVVLRLPLSHFPFPVVKRRPCFIKNNGAPPPPVAINLSAPITNKKKTRKIKTRIP